MVPTWIPALKRRAIFVMSLRDRGIPAPICPTAAAARGKGCEAGNPQACAAAHSDHRTGWKRRAGRIFNRRQRRRHEFFSRKERKERRENLLSSKLKKQLKPQMDTDEHR